MYLYSNIPIKRLLLELESDFIVSLSTSTYGNNEV